VFSDGSFVYIPKGVRCPMELSTYFRINAANTGQFERTLIIADEGSYVSIPLGEQKMLAGVAVDAVFDSVSVATTFKETLAEQGVIFCSFSEAVQEHPELVRQYLGSVVPHTDNFFASLNSAVFSDGSFVYIPKGVRCPMELSTYFRINAANTGQFERTLIIADEGSYVRLLGRLYRTDAGRESTACRRGRAHSAKGRADQILDSTKLVSR